MAELDQVLVSRIRELHARGWSDPAIAKQLGISDRSVLRWRKRLGLRAWPLAQQTVQGRDLSW